MIAAPTLSDSLGSLALVQVVGSTCVWTKNVVEQNLLTTQMSAVAVSYDAECAGEGQCGDGYFS